MAEAATEYAGQLLRLDEAVLPRNSEGAPPAAAAAAAPTTRRTPPACMHAGGILSRLRARRVCGRG